MYRDLTITGFRGFKHFTMSGLGRLNLLVGNNNSGKTSVLEALLMLMGHGDPMGLGISFLTRGEVSGEELSEEHRPVFACSHLFHGHVADSGSEFSFSALNDLVHERFTARIQAQPPAGQSRPTRGPARMQRNVRWLQIRFEGKEPFEDGMLLTHQGDWISEDLDRVLDQGKKEPGYPGAANIEFITTRFLSNQEMIAELGKVLLNPAEQQVVEALRIIEPRLDGVAAVPPARRLNSVPDKAGIFVKLRGMERRVPIGSLGDGIWRLLGIALMLVAARNGFLLIDDIDTGLHYTVMADMWKMVQETARRLNVQVFATTHSRDCVEALASIARPETSDGSEVSIQRIEPERAIAYSESEIVAAAERGIEVR
ncbi:MAG TPA: AAA family ATPase [Pseudomonadota bacterium]|nr:AAA family ATPase [Pseudomonadota bacterium]